MTNVTSEILGSPRDEEALRLEALNLGKLIIGTVRQGQELPRWQAGVFPADADSSSESVLIGNRTNGKAWDGGAEDVLLGVAKSFILTLDGCELQVVRFTRHPNEAGMESLAVVSTVKPEKDKHDEFYTIYEKHRQEQGIVNYNALSPFQKYDIGALVTDLQEVWFGSQLRSTSKHSGWYGLRRLPWKRKAS